MPRWSGCRRAASTRHIVRDGRGLRGTVPEEDADADLARLAAELGRLLYFAGRPEALERLEEGLRLAEGLHLPEVFAQALNSKSLVLGGQGTS